MVSLVGGGVLVEQRRISDEAIDPRAWRSRRPARSASDRAPDCGIIVSSLPSRPVIPLEMGMSFAIPRMNCSLMSSTSRSSPPSSLGNGNITPWFLE